MPFAMAAAPSKTSEIFDDMDAFSLTHTEALSRLLGRWSDRARQRAPHFPARSGFRLLLLLNETQDVETLDLAPGVEAVDGVSLIGEHLENGVQTRQRQQFHVALVQMRELQRSACLLDLREADDEVAQAGGINVVDLAQVEHDLRMARGQQRGDLLPHRRNLPHRDAALQSQNGHIFPLAFSDFQGHKTSLYRGGA